MVRAFDIRPWYREHKDEIDRAVLRVFESGWLVLGPEVKAFEEEFARWSGRRFAVGVNSGTDALALALRALDLENGAEVLTVANTAVPTVAAIRQAGCLPRFVDVCDESLQMDPAALADAVNDRTRCILPVHLHGHPAAMDAIMDVAKSRGIPVIEDCAQAHGAQWRGRAAGAFGQLACFSFYPTKNLGAFGDGGICCTDDEGLAQRLRMLRMYGFREDGYAHIEGVNSRLDELQAAILRVRLRSLDRDLAERRRQAAEYRRLLTGLDLRLCSEGPRARHAYHLFTVRCQRRDELRQALRERGIGTGIHYPVPVHLMKAYCFLGYGDGSLPVTEKAAKELLSLPLYPGLADAEIQEVARQLAALRPLPSAREGEEEGASTP